MKLFLSGLAAVVVMAGCAQQDNQTLNINPGDIVLGTEGTQAFTVEFPNGEAEEVVWATTGGTIDPSGMYTAPNKPGQYEVSVELKSNRNSRGSTTVSVIEGIAIIVTPGDEIALRSEGQQQFTAEVLNTENPAVTWSVTEPNGGTITPEGLYTAPQESGAFHVVAQSVVDPSRVAEVTVNVLDGQGLIGSIQYEGNQTGKVRVVVEDIQGRRLGTVMNQVGNYEVFGMTPGRFYNISAFMDVNGDNTPSASDPQSEKLEIYYTGDVRILNFTLNDIPTSEPDIDSFNIWRIIPFAGGFAIPHISYWEPLGPDTTILYWSSTSTTPGPNDNEGSMTLMGSNQPGYVFVEGLINGVEYHVAAMMTAGDKRSEVKTVGSVVVGTETPAQADIATVKVEVALNFTPEGPLYLWLNGRRDYIQKIEQPQATNAFEFVVDRAGDDFSENDGQFSLQGFVDSNNNGRYDLGEPNQHDYQWRNFKFNPVNGAEFDAGKIEITNDSVHANASTYTGVYFGSGDQPSVDVDVGVVFESNSKVIQNVILVNATNMTAPPMPYSMGAWDSSQIFARWISDEESPTTGEKTFTLLVSYEDGSMETIEKTVAPALPVPTIVSPTHLEEIVTTKPTFTWSYPSELPAGSTVILNVYGYDSDTNWTSPKMPATTTSIEYNFDKSQDDFAPELQPGGQHGFYMELESPSGNRLDLTLEFFTQ